jgi:hypothetical protein
MIEIASALNRIADAIFALSGGVVFLGWMVLKLKNMGGKNKIVVHDDSKDVKS